MRPERLTPPCTRRFFGTCVNRHATSEIKVAAPTQSCRQLRRHRAFRAIQVPTYPQSARSSGEAAAVVGKATFADVECSGKRNRPGAAGQIVAASPIEAAERAVEDLWNAIGRILDTFSSTECRNSFEAAGYDPGRSDHAPTSWDSTRADRLVSAATANPAPGSSPVRAVSRRA